MKGQILVIAIIFLAVVLILSASLFQRVAGFLRFGANATLREQATVAAEAGVERALWQLNQTAGGYSGETNTAIGSTATFTVTITNKTSNLKTITSTGYVPDGTNPKAKRTIKVDASISSESISFSYAVQVGTGGVTMSNSATINGSVYSNKVDGATKSIQGYNSSVITGDAWAVGTISTPDPWVQGTKHQNQPPSVMPTVDYQFWKDAAAAGGTLTCPCNYSVGDQVSLGPKKLIGDLTVTNFAVVTLTGPLWVTGKVTASNNGKIKLADSFGSNGTVLVTDNIITVSNNGIFEPTTANPKGYILVVTTATDNNAIIISNQGANATFYALDGGASLSNQANVTALVANTLTMANSASLTYDQGLASAQFSGGPGGSWQIKKGTYRFTSSP